MGRLNLRGLADRQSQQHTQENCHCHIDPFCDLFRLALTPFFPKLPGVQHHKHQI